MRMPTRVSLKGDKLSTWSARRITLTRRWNIGHKRHLGKAAKNRVTKASSAGRAGPGGSRIPFQGMQIEARFGAVERRENTRGSSPTTAARAGEHRIHQSVRGVRRRQHLRCFGLTGFNIWFRSDGAESLGLVQCQRIWPHRRGEKTKLRHLNRSDSSTIGEAQGQSGRARL